MAAWKRSARSSGEQETRLAGGQQQLAAQHVLAERAGAPVVLAVDVRRRRAAQRHRHRAGNHWRPPAIGERRAPELRDGHAWLAGDDAALRVPGEDAVHARGIEHNRVAIQRGVAIAVSATTQPDADAFRARGREDFGDLLDRAWTRDTTAGALAHAVAFERLDWGGESFGAHRSHLSWGKR